MAEGTGKELIPLRSIATMAVYRAGLPQDAPAVTRTAYLLPAISKARNVAETNEFEPNHNQRMAYVFKGRK
jgi:hypothetical protein